MENLTSERERFRFCWHTAGSRFVFKCKVILTPLPNKHFLRAPPRCLFTDTRNKTTPPGGGAARGTRNFEEPTLGSSYFSGGGDDVTSCEPCLLRRHEKTTYSGRLCARVRELTLGKVTL